MNACNMEVVVVECCGVSDGVIFVFSLECWTTLVGCTVPTPHNLNIKVCPFCNFSFHNRVQHILRIFLDCCSLSIDGNLIPGT